MQRQKHSKIAETFRWNVKNIQTSYVFQDNDQKWHKKGNKSRFYQNEFISTRNSTLNQQKLNIHWTQDIPGTRESSKEDENHLYHQQMRFYRNSDIINSEPIGLPSLDVTAKNTSLQHINKFQSLGSTSKMKTQLKDIMNNQQMNKKNLKSYIKYLSNEKHYKLNDWMSKFQNNGKQNHSKSKFQESPLLSYGVSADQNHFKPRLLSTTDYNEQTNSFKNNKMLKYYEVRSNDKEQINKKNSVDTFYDLKEAKRNSSVNLCSSPIRRMQNQINQKYKNMLQSVQSELNSRLQQLQEVNKNFEKTARQIKKILDLQRSYNDLHKLFFPFKDQEKMVEQFTIENVKNYVMIIPEIIDKETSLSMKMVKVNKTRKKLIQDFLAVLDEKILNKKLNQQSELQLNFIQNQKKYDQKLLKYQIQQKYKEMYGEIENSNENKDELLKEWETFKMEVESYQNSFKYQIILSAIEKFEIRYGKITQLTQKNRLLSYNLHKLINELNQMMKNRFKH